MSKSSNKVLYIWQIRPGSAPQNLIIHAFSFTPILKTFFSRPSITQQMIQFDSIELSLIKVNLNKVNFYKITFDQIVPRKQIGKNEM